MRKITAKAAAKSAEKAIISRMKSPAELGKPEGLSGTVLTLRMIDSTIQSAAQAAASRAATEALSDEVRQLKRLVRQVRQDWIRPLFCGFCGAITGGGIVAFIIIKWLERHY